MGGMKVFVLALALLVSGWADAEEVKATDDPLCMPYYTGKILPTPQQVVTGTTWSRWRTWRLWSARTWTRPAHW